MADRTPPSLHLDDFDRDGAVRETFERFSQLTRAGFLRRTASAGAAALGAVAAWPAVAGAQPASSDITILNFALALEYLQASFYTEAERIGALRGALAHQAHVVGTHERGHVKAFQGLLGSAAIKQPQFNFHGVTENPEAFRSTAVAFEDLATAAYKQQAPLIKSKSYLAGALAIHSVEARHAAWIRRLAGFLPAAHPFDDPLSDAKVVDIVNSTHFVTLRDPQTATEAAPRFTG
ncbi:MAG: ferritin-like domain-containing protein [Solirubrobacterales bacterium]|nr:ferritin-like domain-containing protein [Solirubrobacterales bacterium]